MLGESLMEHREISKASLGRIPLYLKYLKKLPPETLTVSATTVAKDLGLGDVQVRKDLAAMCGNGKPKIGYIKNNLICSLEKFSGCENGKTIIIGAGKLGMALLEYSGFEEYGCTVSAAFDKKVTEPIKLDSGKVIYPMEDLSRFCRDNDIKIGIIAVPADAAQTVLNILCENGIKNIWTFAPVKLYKPADVLIRYENLALSLAHLKSQIIE